MSATYTPSVGDAVVHDPTGTTVLVTDIEVDENGQRWFTAEGHGLSVTDRIEDFDTWGFSLLRRAGDQ